MKHTTRRRFLQSSALLLATAFTGSAFSTRQKLPPLSFSTLGCPDWSFPQIVDFAAQHGYQGLELRGLHHEMDLPECKEFSTDAARKATMELMQAKGLKFVNLGSSATMHFAEGAERNKHLDEGRRFIDLAQHINCPYIRVFPNEIPKGQEKQPTLDLIAKGLLELGDHAKGSGVTVLMETHGQIVQIADLQQVMAASEHPNVGLVWDIVNMWTVTKEPPASAYNALKKYIHHTHIKDAKLAGDKLEYALLGQGDTPIFAGIDVLVEGGYKGFFSFEWEKLWHPEIAAPEIALADYPKAMKKHFA